MTEGKLELGDGDVPAPGTLEMSQLLHSVINQLLSQLPFDFTSGNVMEACTKILIDAGMVAVMGGTETKEQLKADIARVSDAAIDSWRNEDSPLDYKQGASLQ